MIAVDGRTLIVQNPRDNDNSSVWKISGLPSETTLQWIRGTPSDSVASHVLTAAETVFTLHRTCTEITILGERTLSDALINAGISLPLHKNAPRIARDMLWQAPQLWLPSPVSPVPLRYTLSDGKRHPIRPRKERGTAYQRFIPWLGKTFSFRAINIDQDLPLIHRWMNEPAVAKVWQEEGDLEKHRAYLTAIEKDPHMQSLIACLDDEPFGYFEVYWAKENRIAPFYDADDFDRGWHVLIGEPSFRGKDFATAWLTSISHYLFLADPRTRRVVGEPRADHAQQLRNLDKSGYAKVKEFDFPHKRAMLVMLLREHYFGGAYWWPRSDEAITSIPSQS